MRRKDSALRVLMVTPRFFPSTGGVELHVHEVARRLSSMGLAILVLTTNPGGRLPGDEQIDGVQVRRVRTWPDQRDVYFAPGIYRVVRDGSWDLLHCQSYHTLLPAMAMAAALRARIPYVLTFHSGGHSSPLRNALRGTQRDVLRPLLARATRLIAVSEFEARFFSDKLHLPRERFAVIANGSNLPVQEVQPKTIDHYPLIVSVGRLERYKGHQRILTALPLILEKVPEARLLILGSGPYERTLRQLTETLSLDDRVEIGSLAAADRLAMANVLARASLVVNLSEYESYGIAAMEAVSLGRPVLVADTSALSEIAARGLAQSIPLDSSPRQVAEAVVHMLHNPPSPRKVELPTWDQCAAQMCSLYEEIAGQELPCAC